MATTYQILVKHLDGHTQCLQFPSPTLTGLALKQALCLAPNLRLVTGTLDVADETLITASSPSNLFPSLTLLPRLRGGKGGFGSLLRGAATKAGQKKTNNFDACRDMSGRRLRHVNAEKKLEEWKAEAEDRRLVKLGEEFLKKKAKEVKKGKGKDGEVEKYLEKYRQDSEKCMEAMEESVRESFALYRDGKRKVLPTAGGSASKRMKIWLGKKKVEESDSDEGDDEDEDDREKSVVLVDGNCTGHDTEEEGSSAAGLVSSNSDGESSGRLSEQSNLEEAMRVSGDEHSLGGASENCTLGEVNGNFESPSMEQGLITGDSNTEPDVLAEAVMGATEDVAVAQNYVVSTLEEVPEMTEVKPAVERLVDPEIIDKETVVQTTDSCNLEEPLNFDKYNSAVELEVLGMERLKAELHSRGLKCGGTLQERAARLFLLKTTPFEKLPKKVLAAKNGGK